MIHKNERKYLVKTKPKQNKFSINGQKKNVKLEKSITTHNQIKRLNFIIYKEHNIYEMKLSNDPKEQASYRQFIEKINTLVVKM